MALKRKAQGQPPSRRRRLLTRFSDASSADLPSRADVPARANMPEWTDEGDAAHKDVAAMPPADPGDATDEEIDEDMQAALHALAGRHRGRKTGSGAGDKRKADADYSSNPHSQKARLRSDNLNKYERDIERARNSASSWVSKMLKKYKQSPEFLALAPAARAQAEKDERERLKQRREKEFSTTSQTAVIASILVKCRDVFKQSQALHDLADTITLQADGVPADSDQYYRWDEDEGRDETAETEWKRRRAGHRNTSMDEGIYGAMQEAVTRFQLDHHVPNEPTTLQFDQSCFRIVSKEFRMRLGAVASKCTALDNAALYAFDAAGKREDDFSLARYLTGVQKLYQATTPETVFTSDDKRMLRFVWGCAQDPWVDLPGPADWWPSVAQDGSPADDVAQKWYETRGFDIGKYTDEQYRAAGRVLMGQQPPCGWFEHMQKAGGEIAWL